MSRDGKFSKVIPNVKLATRLDADGNEVDVEIREDSEGAQHRKMIFDLLMSAGYFRVMIRNLSDFDKIVGGMSWCIEACDFDVEVDLLFHENLTIGQKISLVERVVEVLPQMKCPTILEPHQIQGLDFINIYPVIQWLVKESVNMRNEKAERLKIFSIGQFHNHFQLESSEKARAERREVLKLVRKIDDLYAPRRQFKRKSNVDPEDDRSRVRLTLLEYGLKSFSRRTARLSDSKEASTGQDDSEELEQEDIDVDHLLNENLAIAREEAHENLNLTEEERREITKHYENLKMEMLVDPKQLSERNKIKNLEEVEAMLKKRLIRVAQENEALAADVQSLSEQRESAKAEAALLENEFRAMEVKEQEADPADVEEIKNLILENEKVQREEAAFKESCKKIIEELVQKIEDAEALAAMPDEEFDLEHDEELRREEEKLRLARLQLAKKNRAVMSLQRQLDNIPCQVELSQYQKRFLELYNNVAAKHKETKQFYALYNSLSETHTYLEKELTLLNSIHDNYHQAMATVHSKEQFLKKFEDIVEGVTAMKFKIKKKNDDEKNRKDSLNAELLGFIDLQRKYAAMVKQFREVCEKQ